MEKAKEIISFVEEAFKDGTSAYEVEQNLFKKVLEIGHHALGLLFDLYGKCDLGEEQKLSNERIVKRLPKAHCRGYFSIFGEFELAQMVYGSREGQKIEYVPLDSKLQLPKSKYSYLLQNWDQSLATENPYKKVYIRDRYFLGENKKKIINLGKFSKNG